MSENERSKAENEIYAGGYVTGYAAGFRRAQVLAARDTREADSKLESVMVEVLLLRLQSPTTSKN